MSGEGVDAGRLARLRSAERLTYLDPARIWEAVEPVESGTVVDVGAGVGYLSLPLARAFPDADIVACDVSQGMLEHLAEQAQAEGLANLRCVLTHDAEIGLPDGCADLLVMCQVHHELADAPGLLAECRRVLAPGAAIAIIDWKDTPSDRNPAGGRRVPEAVIRDQLAGAGFSAVTAHAIYEHHSFVTARA